MQFYSDINRIEEKRDRLPDIIHSSESNLGITLHSVSSVEVAETTKVVENCHRYCKLPSLKSSIYIVKQIT